MQSFASSKIKLPLRALSFLTLFEWPPQKLAKTQNDMISRNRANREHDVTSNGKRQKWNISCRLYSAVYTVEWKYLYSRWIVGDIYLFLCDDLVRIRRKEHKFRGNREIKHDVYSKRQTANGKRQTAKMKLLPSLFSCVYSRVKLFVFAMNGRRRYSMFVCFIYG